MISEQPIEPIRATRRDRRTREQRAAAFRQADESYQKYRPDYPAEIADAVAELAQQAGGTIIDCGAGTGKFTDMLLARGCEVIAVEPAEAMARQLAARLPQVRVVDARGEATGLADGCASVMTYAQSWHWVDEVAASAEAHRLLAPGGHLVLIWNQFDTEVAWVHRLTRIMRSGDVHLTRGYRDLAPYFGVPRRLTSSFTQDLLPRDVMALARTRSSYLAASEAVRGRMQDNLRWYLNEHLGYGEDDIVSLPYTCVAWVYERLTP